MHRIFLFIIIIIFFTGCSPTNQIGQAIQEGINQTQTAANTPISTTIPTITATNTTTLLPKSTEKPTQTETLRPSPTLPSSPTATTLPTRSPTPSKTIKPTETPELPALSNLVLSDAEILQINDNWYTPIKRTKLYLDNPEICKIDCVGLRLESLDNHTTLSWILYRAKSPKNAVYSTFGIREYFLNKENFSDLEFSRNSEIPSFTWSASKNDREFILYSVQGPAVFTLFLQGTTPQNPSAVIDQFYQYTLLQLEKLSTSGYINPDVNLLPFPVE